MTNIERKFTLSSVFTDVSKMKMHEDKYGIQENHYGFTCELSIERVDNDFGVYLFCYPQHEKEWQIEVEWVFECISVAGETARNTATSDFTGKSGWGEQKFIDWSELLEKFAKDDKIEVKCHVTIKKVTGLDKKPLALFDESMKKYSDVVIKVGNQKFHVVKLTLARYSPYFEAMFLGNFKESEKSEVELKEVDPQDFQDYLELLHMQSPISDWNVEKLLEFADMHETPLVTEKCVEHLMSYKSKLSRKDKVRLASRFNQKKLLDFCLNECETLEDLRDMMPDDVTDFDPKILKSAMDKIFDNAPMDLKLL